MKQETLIAYATSFVSFLIEHVGVSSFEKILLFGSVARNDFDQESDIDIFIDTKKEIEKGVQQALSLFQLSETAKKWKLKGITQEISLKIGDLSQWKLRRDILTDSIVLYGKQKEMPREVEYYLLLQPTFTKFSKSKKVHLWRKLHGYSQKVNKKTYTTQGLLQEVTGKKIEHGLLIPIKRKKVILDFLHQEKIPYTVHEVWSDTI